MPYLVRRFVEPFTQRVVSPPDIDHKLVYSRSVYILGVFLCNMFNTQISDSLYLNL